MRTYLRRARWGAGGLPLGVPRTLRGGSFPRRALASRGPNDAPGDATEERVTSDGQLALSLEELRDAVVARGSVAPATATAAELQAILLSRAPIDEHHDPAYSLLSAAMTRSTSTQLPQDDTAPGVVGELCAATETTIEVGPMHGQVSVASARAGRVTATASVQWGQKIVNNVTGKTTMRPSRGAVYGLCGR